MFRILQRHCRTVFPAANSFNKNSSDGGMFLLQPPLDPRQAGSSRITGVPVATRDSLLQWLCYHSDLDDPMYEGWVDEHATNHRGFVDPVQWTTSTTVQDAIRFTFQCSGGRLDWAIRTYQILSEQAKLHQTTSMREEAGIRIAATSQFVGTSHDKHRFSYRIRIENVSASHFQLMGRSWIIQEDRHVEPIRVHDPMGGAVGQFPILEGGQAFEYMSGCELSSATGVMKGCYHFRDVESDAYFEIAVEPFPLQNDQSSESEL